LWVIIMELLRHLPGAWNFEVACKIFGKFVQPWAYVKIQFLLGRKHAKFSQFLPLKEVYVNWCSLRESHETQKSSLCKNLALHSEKLSVRCQCSNRTALSSGLCARLPTFETNSYIFMVTPHINDNKCFVL